MLADVLSALQILREIKGIYDALQANQDAMRRLCNRTTIFHQFLDELESNLQSCNGVNPIDSSLQMGVKTLGKLLAEIKQFLEKSAQVGTSTSRNFLKSGYKLTVNVPNRNEIAENLASFNQRINDCATTLMPGLEMNFEKERRLDTEALKTQLDEATDGVMRELVDIKGNSSKLMEFVQEMKSHSADMRTDILQQIVELEKKISTKRTLTMKDLGELEEVLCANKDEFKTVLDERLTLFLSSVKQVEALINGLKSSTDSTNVTVQASLRGLEGKVLRCSSVTLKEINDLKAELKGDHIDLMTQIEKQLKELSLVSFERDLREVKELIGKFQADSGKNNRGLQDQLSALQAKIDSNAASSISLKELNEVKMALSAENQELFLLVESKFSSLDLLSVRRDVVEVRSLISELKNKSDTNNVKLAQQLESLERGLQANGSVSVELIGQLKAELKGQNFSLFEKIVRQIDQKFQKLDHFEDLIRQNFHEVKTDLKEGFDNVGNQLSEITILLKIINDGRLTSDDTKARADLLKKVQIPGSSTIEFSASVLGMGGFGQVFKGRFDGDEVAIKSLMTTTEAQMEAVENEVLLMHHLANPRPYQKILTCYGIWKDKDNVSYIVLEYAPYGSLVELVNNRTDFPELPIRLQCGWVLDLSYAMEFIHSKKVKHRDIKADNLLVFPQMRVKLCDFGLSKQQTSKVSSAVGVGTDGFIAPELFTGQGSSFKSDVYSWAMTFYQIVMRRYPPGIERGVSSATLIENLIEELTERVPKVDFTYLKSFLSSCISQLSEQRPTASEVVKNMSSLVDMIGGDPRNGKQAGDKEVIADIEQKLIKRTRTVQTPVSSSINTTVDSANSASSPTMPPGSSTSTLNDTWTAPLSTLVSTKDPSPSKIQDSHNESVETVGLKDLDFDQTVALLIHLGCPDSIEERLLQQGLDENTFNGQTVCDWKNVDELIDTCGLKAIKRHLLKGIFTELDELREKGVPLSLLSELRETLDKRLEALFKEVEAVMNDVNRDISQAVKLYLKAGQKGYAPAMNALGVCYQCGIGVSKDELEALRWYIRAMEKGDSNARINFKDLYNQGAKAIRDEANVVVDNFKIEARKGDTGAMTNLGYLYYNGIGVAKDRAEAVRWYRLAADKGYAAAMNSLGCCYRDGIGVAKDPAEAVRWFRLVAEKGDAVACHNLGHLYYNGIGVAQDRAEAVRWYRPAADKGYAAAMNSLGCCYRDGIGVAKDPAEAVRWFRLGAEKGDAAAMSGLGHCYDTGIGVATNHTAAVRWYRLAAEKGDAIASHNLGFLYHNGIGVTIDHTEAMRWYRLAADKGNADAMNNLGTYYQNGIGVAKDHTEAVRWYRLAADKGDRAAMNNLGSCYYHGIGVTTDPVEAVRWYRLGAEKGDAAAINNLAICYENGFGVAQDHVEAARWKQMAKK